MTKPERSEAYDFDQVAARLGHAGMTLLALRVAGLRPAGYGSSMPDPMGTVAPGGRIAVPNSRAISAMDEALSWVGLIPGEQLELRRLVNSRALTNPRTGKPLYSWRTLGRWLGCSDATAKTRWIGAVQIIVSRLNARPFCRQPPTRGTREATVAVLEAAARRRPLQPLERRRQVESA